jgi:hypothetical protein
MRETEEIERLGLTEPACLTPSGGVPPELDQARLLAVQFQTELREPLTKICDEPLCVIMILKAHNEVVGLCRVPDYAECGGEGAGQRCCGVLGVRHNPGCSEGL